MPTRAAAAPAKAPAKKTATAASKPKLKPAKKSAPAKKVAAKSAGKPALKKPYPPIAKGATAAKTAAKRAAAPLPKVSKPKQKLVRDSFTMPRADFDLIAALKERLLSLRVFVKKSELLRAGLHALTGLDDAKLASTMKGLTPLKPGRPKNSD
ncbi:MAG TPA: hypothetical protein VE029_00625 [Rhizobacter sp.]|nr:hypothetical protein [Rhizobacter sp.]